MDDGRDGSWALSGRVPRAGIASTPNLPHHPQHGPHQLNSEVRDYQHEQRRHDNDEIAPGAAYSSKVDVAIEAGFTGAF